MAFEVDISALQDTFRVETSSEGDHSHWGIYKAKKQEKIEAIKFGNRQIKDAYWLLGFI